MTLHPETTSNDSRPTAGDRRDGRIRVAHLLHTVAHGGVETVLINWLKTMDRSRFDVRTVIFRNPGGTEMAFEESAEAAGLKVDYLQWSRWKPVFRCARELARYVTEHEIDIIHCHNTYANLVGLRAGSQLPVKTVTTFYVWGDFGFKRNILQRIDEWAMWRFDRVTAHCQQCFRDTVARRYPEDDLRLLICGYPPVTLDFDDAHRQSLRAELGVLEGETVLTYLARFWPEKAHDSLLKAFALALERNPRLRLLLPGTGPSLEEVKALASAMGLTSHVSFLGFFPDFHKLLAASDIQVHPSDNEGVSLAVCAGMALGMPIIATDVGGLPEILKDGQSAVMIPPRNPEALANAILDLADNRERSLRLGQEAKRFIEEEYSLDIATRNLEAVYEELAGR